MTTQPPGWYDDGRGERRWWDGASWTEHVATPRAERTRAESDQPTLPLDAEGPVRVAPAPPYTPSGSPYTPSGFPYPPSGSPYAPSGSQISDTLPTYGEPTTSPGPARSMMWVVWLVVGIVALGVVVALALLTPALLNGFTAGGAPAASPTTSAVSGPSSAPSDASPTDQSSAAPIDGAPSASDREAAIDAVMRHNSSWLTGDCEAYLASTTEQFRTAVMLVPDCESFDTESRLFAGQVDGYETTIGEVEAVGSAVVVSTTETYTSAYDAEGNQTEEPMPYEDRYEYILIESDAGWVIDDFFAE